MPYFNALNFERPDPNTVMNAFAGGRQMGIQDRTRAAATGMGNALMRGDWAGAQGAAAESGDPGMIVQAQQAGQSGQQHAAQQHIEGLKAIGNAAKYADTPEKWEKLKAESVAAGHPVDPQYANFEGGRDMLLGKLGIDPLEGKMNQLKLQGMQQQVDMAGKPQFGDVGYNALGIPQKGWIDPYKRTVTPAELPGQQTDQPAQQLTGEDYLKTLDPSVANQVKAIVDGRMQVPGGMAMKTPYWQGMMQHVTRVDPNFDAINYNARSKTRQDFTAGTGARNLASFNTAISHLDTLNKAVEALDNSDYTMLNSASNAIAGFGNKDRQVKIKNFGVARDAVAEELTKAFKGTGGSLTEVEGWQKLLNEADGKAAQMAAIKQGIDLLEGRIAAVGDQYNRGMSLTKDPLELLSPKAREVLIKLKTGLTGKDQSKASNPASGGAPITGTLPNGSKAWFDQSTGQWMQD